MIIPLFLCLYLLFFVIDIVVLGVWSGSNFLVRLGGFHLFMFLLVVSLFRVEFSSLAEKYQTRIVFSPRVYGFFSLASGLFLSSFFGLVTFDDYLARGVLLTLFLFRLGVKLFDFFPVKTRQVQRLMFWCIILGGGSLLMLVRGSVGQLFDSLNGPRVGNIGNNQELSGGQEIQPGENTGNKIISSGIALDDIEDFFQTGSGVGSGEKSTGSGEEEKTISSGDNLVDDKPITYRLLLPYLDAEGYLPPVRETPSFINVSKQESIYQAFQRAWGLKMIGTNINPDWQVRCENYMVLIGLAKDRDIDVALPLLDAYRKAARAYDSLGSCVSRDQVATQDMMREIKKSVEISL